MDGTPITAVFIGIAAGIAILYLAIIKPFIEGMREGNREIDRRRHRFPEHCPMCGQETRMTRELRCAYCGEYLGPEADEQIDSMSQG